LRRNSTRKNTQSGAWSKEESESKQASHIREKIKRVPAVWEPFGGRIARGKKSGRAGCSKKDRRTSFV